MRQSGQKTPTAISREITSPLNAIPPKARIVIIFIAVRLFLKYANSESPNKTGYTTSAIIGNGIPNTRDSGKFIKLVQEKVALISQNDDPKSEF